MALVALTAGGCASMPRFDTRAMGSIELRDVPFFPQTRFHCGPAALATILAYDGLAVDADTLAPEVYVKGLKGSLQADLLGTTRRRGLIPYVLEPTPAALFAALADGKPVLVLQNLGFKRMPVWHYAVVVGFDAGRRRVILRSGRTRRRRVRLRRFLRSWELGGNWAIAALRPAELPASVLAGRYIRALAAAGPTLGDRAAESYAAALERWPRNPLVLFAAAGYDLAGGRFDAAEKLYEALLAFEPHHAAARNNLANAFAAQGCRAEALRQARAALADVPAESPLREPVEDTLAQIEASPMAKEPRFCPRLAVSTGPP